MAGYGAGMSSILATLLVLAADGTGTGNSPDKGWGVGIIIAVVVAAIVVIGLVCLFFARRGSRVPGRDPHPPGQVGRR
jgi:hypothetical protein